MSVQGLLPSLLLLGALFLLALGLSQRLAPPSVESWTGMRRLLYWAIGLHALHFIEEASTGFAARFPALFGLNPIPDPAFWSVNLVLLAIWSAGTRLPQPRMLMLAAYWFLGLASAANAVAHPAMALLSGGYFPGLLSSPLSGLIGIMLLRSLYQNAVQTEGS